MLSKTNLLSYDFLLMKGRANFIRPNSFSSLKCGFDEFVRRAMWPLLKPSRSVELRTLFSDISICVVSLFKADFFDNGLEASEVHLFSASISPTSTWYFGSQRTIFYSRSLGFHIRHAVFAKAWCSWATVVIILLGSFPSFDFSKWEWNGRLLFSHQLRRFLLDAEDGLIPFVRYLELSVCLSG